MRSASRVSIASRKRAPSIMRAAVPSIAPRIRFCSFKPSIVVASRLRHCSMASIISVWISGEIGSDATRSPSVLLSSSTAFAAAVSRLASASAVRLLSFRDSMAMFCVAWSVSLDCTE